MRLIQNSTEAIIRCRRETERNKFFDRQARGRMRPGAAPHSNTQGSKDKLGTMPGAIACGSMQAA